VDPKKQAEQVKTVVVSVPSTAGRADAEPARRAPADGYPRNVPPARQAAAKTVTTRTATGKAGSATEVARRLGHSVAMLLKVYANCVDGDEAISNQRIAAALAGADRGDLESGPDQGP
jgi:DNA invertase Pin-like site-specific DNA recombinase